MAEHNIARRQFSHLHNKYTSGSTMMEELDRNAFYTSVSNKITIFMRACIKMNDMELGENIDGCNRYFQRCEHHGTSSSDPNLRI
jgi:hypothetical protein